ncbi:MAG: PqqD family protein [Candidatus Izemoplasmataceae bacterium]
MKIKDTFVLRTVAKQHIIFPTGNEAINFSGLMRLNETGKALFDYLKTNRSYEELVDYLISAYDIDQERAEKDVDNFIKELDALDIIE